MLGQSEHMRNYNDGDYRHKTPAQSHHELGGFSSNRNNEDGNYHGGNDLEADFD